MTLVGLYHDFESVPISLGSKRTIERILEFTSDYGTIIVRKAFADWNNAAYPRKIQLFLHNAGIELSHIPHQRVNDVDFVVERTVLSDTATYNYSTVVLIANDKDYIHLINELRKREVYVVVVGRNNANRVLVQSANRFLSIDEVSTTSTINMTHQGVESEV